MFDSFISSKLVDSILNSSWFEEASFLRLQFTLWRNTIIISSITFFNVVCFVLALFLWSTNRQTQIRPSKSQSTRRLVHPEQKKRKIPYQSDLDKDDNSNLSKNNIDPDFSDDCGCSSKSRENIFRKLSMEDFDIDEEDDEDDEDIGTIKNDSTAINYYMNEVDISFGEDDKAPVSLMRNTQFRSMREDIRQFIMHMNLFSYLSDDALKVVLKYMNYIDLPNEGSVLPSCDFSHLSEASSQELDDNEKLDGSLYIVIDGSVDCSCHLDDVGHCNRNDHQYSKMHFTAGPGDLITSQLAMVSDLVRLFLNENDVSEVKGIHPVVVVRAITSAPNTRVLRIPSIVYMKILDKFPHEVNLLTQTILGRTQRVTMQTLVKNFGLTDQIIAQKYSFWNGSNIENNMHDDPDWHNKLLTLQNIDLSKEKRDKSNVGSDIRPINVTNSTLQVAASLAASQLGTTRNEDIILIRDSSSVLEINAGSAIIQTGKKSDYLYFLIRGSLEIGNYITNISDTGLKKTMARPLGISMKDSNLNAEELEKENISFQTSYTVTAGAILGQLSAFTGEVGMVTIRVSPNSEKPAAVLQIPKHVFMELVSSNNAIFIQCLKSILQYDFSPVVHLLDWGLRWRDVNSGSLLVRKGESCKATYVVLNGRLRSDKKREKHNPVTQEEYGRGSCIGEVQVLTGDIMPSDVYAMRDSELAEVPIGVLEFIMKMFPACGMHFATVCVHQIQQRFMERENRNAIKQASSGLPSYKLSVATIAVIPICFGSDNEEISRFCENLTSCLRNIATCATMTKLLVRRKLGKVDPKNFVFTLKLSRLLGDLEENNRLVVYQADSKLNWWTKTCIEHSDCVLLVVDSQKTPESDRLLKFLTHTQTNYLKKRVEIVVLAKQAKDDEANRSHRLNEWLEKLPFATSNNLIRVSETGLAVLDKNDLQRMCRRITGCSLGLALGGGGARGIAHLGVIKALLEAGVSIDIVGGTSQGAFIGALFARSPDDFDLVVQRAKVMADKMASMRDKVFDLTLPLVSYFNGRRFNQTIQELLGKETRIEDLILSYFCVSTDLRIYDQKVHRRGLCWKYVRASMSLQGYLPPISEDGSLLLDGGYMCVVPNDVMSKEIGARAVIAVDVSREEMPDYYEYGSNLSGFWLLWNSWNPFVKTVRVPSMGELSSRLIWVHSSRQQQKIKSQCDLFLAPEVHNYGTLDYHLFDEIFELGYSYTKARIEGFLKDPANQWILRK